ncbi:hypothetical protein DFS34DRAFT_253989 [Phlyctochytrium arcticum]|nr:hypothetical protein DFS34DRAFT_253989 [Phlyctochytrium arcticum]
MQRAEELAESTPEITHAKIEDESDLFLSEVHIDARHSSARTNAHDRPTTLFKLNKSLRSSPQDRDILIVHDMATPLEAVGKQVWSGALLLADLVLSLPQLFSPNDTILELGAGVALTAIAAGFRCKRVYATDLDVPGLGVLDLCAKNVRLNGLDNVILVRNLNLLDETPNGFPSASSAPYGWTADNLSDVRDHCRILLAADVVYDNAVTFALVKRLRLLLEPTRLGDMRVLYMSIEKRMQFSLDDNDVAAPAHDYFFATLEATNNDARESDLPKVLVAEEVDWSDIPQWLEYERVEQLKLYRITLQTEYH